MASWGEKASRCKAMFPPLARATRFYHSSFKCKSSLNTGPRRANKKVLSLNRGWKYASFLHYTTRFLLFFHAARCKETCWITKHRVHYVMFKPRPEGSWFWMYKNLPYFQTSLVFQGKPRNSEEGWVLVMVCDGPLSNWVSSLLRLLLRCQCMPAGTSSYFQFQAKTNKRFPPHSGYKNERKLTKLVVEQCDQKLTSFLTGPNLFTLLFYPFSFSSPFYSI